MRIPPTIAAAFAAAMLAFPPDSSAQSAPPPLPALTTQQSAEVARHLATYQAGVDARVARGEVSAEDAARLLQWHEWQLARQAAGLAPLPPVAYEQPPPDDRAAPPVYDDPSYYGTLPAPYYSPDYPPYYAYPPPYDAYPPAYYRGAGPYYYWGGTICGGAFGRHFGARICL